MTNQDLLKMHPPDGIDADDLLTIAAFHQVDVEDLTDREIESYPAAFAEECRRARQEMFNQRRWR